MAPCLRGRRSHGWSPSWHHQWVQSKSGGGSRWPRPCPGRVPLGRTGSMESPAMDADCENDPWVLGCKGRIQNGWTLPRTFRQLQLINQHQTYSRFVVGLYSGSWFLFFKRYVRKNHHSFQFKDVQTEIVFHSLPWTTFTPFFFTAAARQVVAPATAATTAARPPIAPEDALPVILEPWATPAPRNAAGAAPLGRRKAASLTPLPMIPPDVTGVDMVTEAQGRAEFELAKGAGWMDCVTHGMATPKDEAGGIWRAATSNSTRMNMNWVYCKCWTLKVLGPSLKFIVGSKESYSDSAGRQLHIFGAARWVQQCNGHHNCLNGKILGVVGLKMKGTPTLNLGDHLPQLPVGATISVEFGSVDLHMVTVGLPLWPKGSGTTKSKPKLHRKRVFGMAHFKKCPWNVHNVKDWYSAS